MTSKSKIFEALSSVDWNSNVSQFLSDSNETAKALEVYSTKIAHWSYQLEKVDKGNPALCFVREAQISVQYVVSLIALGLYKPSVMSARALVECLMYYTFFRKHKEELHTLIREDNYFVTRTEILNYHNLHTPDFKRRSNKIGLQNKLEKWYSEASGIVHGQIPGKLVSTPRLAETGFNQDHATAAADLFYRGVDISNLFLLATVGQKFWSNFSRTAKENMIKGLSGQQKDELQLDSA